MALIARLERFVALPVFTVSVLTLTPITVLASQPPTPSAVKIPLSSAAEAVSAAIKAGLDPAAALVEPSAAATEGALPGQPSIAHRLYDHGEQAFFRADFSKSRAMYLAATQVAPTWHSPYFRLGLVALNENDVPQAVDYLQRVIRLAPDSPEAVYAAQLLPPLLSDR